MSEKENITVHREQALAEIKEARATILVRDGADASVFVGVNNLGVGTKGQRFEGQPILRIFGGEEWKRELSIYCKADLAVRAIESFKDELTQAVTINEIDKSVLQIRYFGIECSSQGVWGTGEGVRDPRAHILPEMLTDTEVSWPFVYVYAQISALPAIADVDAILENAIKGAKICTKKWAEDAVTSSELKNVAEKAAKAGDHKTAFSLLEKSIVREQSERAAAEAAANAPPPPEPPREKEEKKSFKPQTVYSLSDGTQHVIPAGLYGTNEWISKTLEAQKLVDESHLAKLAAEDAEAAAAAAEEETEAEAAAAEEETAADDTIVDKLGDKLTTTKIINDDDEDRQRAWDQAAAALAAQAAAIWG